MQKTLTKEQLAEKLNGMEYADDFPKELLEAAKKNKLVIISGCSDDIVSFHGAIADEDYAVDGGIIRLTEKGIPTNDCDNENCPFFASWLKNAIQTGAVLEIKVFWCGQCKDERMDAAQYAALGKPTWCYEIKAVVGRYRREDIDRLAATFDIFDSNDGVQEYYCRGIVLDLTEVWPSKSYEQYVM